jgi:hypothetical protein
VGEHRIPPSGPRPDPKEAFQVYEAATGKMISVRNMTLEQLRRHLPQATQAHKQATLEAMKAFGEATNIAKIAACIQFEIERQEKKETPELKLATLSDLKNLSK